MVEVGQPTELAEAFVAAMRRSGAHGRAAGRARARVRGSSRIRSAERGRRSAPRSSSRPRPRLSTSRPSRSGSPPSPSPPSRSSRGSPRRSFRPHPTRSSPPLPCTAGSGRRAAGARCAGSQRSVLEEGRLAFAQAQDAEAAQGSEASKAPKVAKAAKVTGASTGPFWKKELSLGRKKAAVDPEAFELPRAKSAPFWKRDLALPKPGLPKLPSGRRKQGGHKVQRMVGLKIGASQLAAARVSNNGVAELQQIARGPLAAGIVVGGELRDPEALGDALKAFFAKNKLPKKGVRLGIASNRIGVRIIEIVGDRRRQAARERRAVPRPGGAADPARRGGARLSRARRVRRRRRADPSSASCSSSRTANWSSGTSARAGRPGSRSPASTSRRLRCSARSARPPTATASALVAVAIGHDRSTFAVSDGRICEFTRVARVGRLRRSTLRLPVHSTARRPRSRHSSGPVARDRLGVPEGLTPEQTRQSPLDAVRRAGAVVRARARLVAPVLPEPAWQSLASARSWSPAAPRSFPASPRSSSA